jgi:glucose/arabinose dehydrogenase
MYQHSLLRLASFIGLIFVTFTACTSERSEVTASASAPAVTDSNGCSEGNGGLRLPAGWCASVFADNLGHARHLAVAPTGDLYVNTWSSNYNGWTNAPGGFIVALRDADHDGKAEVIERFGTMYQSGKTGGGTGIAVQGDALYAEVDDKIVRYRLNSGSIVPSGESEIILSGLPMNGDHPMHPFFVTTDGTLYVSSGSATDSCQVKNRTRESPGRTPCDELTTRSGIWRYDANKTGQVFSPAERFATGIRNAVGMAAIGNTLFAAIHGRDQLSSNWPKLYTDAQSNELPAELFVRIDQGDDFGWPYCYYDGMQHKYVQAPEYGGDGGKAVGDCAGKKQPAVFFPGHWAPEAVAFYTGNTFPDKYRNGAFVSFHGSWNRKPTQAGFLVAFVPFQGGKPSGNYEEFATGFAGTQPLRDPKNAPYRPMGLAVGTDGALYVSDDVKGRIWRITYAGGTQAKGTDPSAPTP